MAIFSDRRRNKRCARICFHKHHCGPFVPKTLRRQTVPIEALEKRGFALLRVQPLPRGLERVHFVGGLGKYETVHFENPAATI